MILVDFSLVFFPTYFFFIQLSLLGYLGEVLSSDPILENWPQYTTQSRLVFIQ